MSHASVLVAVDCERAEIEQAVEHEMAPFDENGKWFKDGSRWDYWVIGSRMDGWLCDGNVIQVKAVNLEQLRNRQLERLRKNWHEAQAESKQVQTVIYGLKPGEGIEAYCARKLPHAFPAHYAFLRNRRWHEAERMGWFGLAAATECEAANPERVGKCLFRDAESKAEVICWKCGEEEWGTRFYDRFVKPLPPETFLVTVDYHV